MDDNLSESQNEFIELNKKEYKDKYKDITWLTPDQELSFDKRRKQLIESISTDGEILCEGSKIVYGLRSPGCVCCGDGTWSCLFIHDYCNCNCFFCPAEQSGPNISITNGLEFKNPKDYGDYIEKFGIKGVGISGGEPFLSSKKTLEYLNYLKDRFKNNVYIWIYTNGKLLTLDILKQLKDSRLDEIRFNIVAGNYELGLIPEAVKFIPNVTVEIPAVPEDLEILKVKVKELQDAGVRFLNLHQLRLTPYNFDKIIKRNYSFMHGKKVVVPESELTALCLIEYARTQKLKLSINYCSFVYKNRFEPLAVRKRAALKIKRNYEEITDNGFVRSFCLIADQDKIAEISISLIDQSVSKELFHVNGKRLYFSAQLLDKIDIDKFKIYVTYVKASLLNKLSYHYPFEEILLNDLKKVVIERIKVSDEIELNVDDYLFFCKYLKRVNKDNICLSDCKKKAFLEFEIIPFGLASYS